MKKKKGKTITLSVVVLIALTALITQITNHSLSMLWSFVADFFTRPTFQISLANCIVYRTNYTDFPVCEMDILVNNSAKEDITVELKEIALFRNGIVYKFSSGTETIKTGTIDSFVKHIKFKDEILDSALKIPQEPKNANFKLLYQYVNEKSIDSTVVDSSKVIKCTYWQYPIFQSKNEALASGALPMEISGPIYWSNKSSGKNGLVELNLNVYMDRYGLRDFNGKKFMQDLVNNKTEMSIYLPSFRRQYGGVYQGLLASDTANIKVMSFPSDVLGKLGDYEETNLLGTTIEQDFSNIKEFIHYTFDPAKSNGTFEFYRRNCEYFVLFVYEEKRQIEQQTETMRSLGYRVDYGQTGRLELIKDIYSFVPIEKADAFAAKINEYVDSLNVVVRKDGCLIFFPEPVDSSSALMIRSDIAQSTGKNNSLIVSFDCTPKKYSSIVAPFSIPVLVFTNFSDSTKLASLDSVRLKQY
jgi:hypothetical protein